MDSINEEWQIHAQNMCNGENISSSLTAVLGWG